MSPGSDGPCLGLKVKAKFVEEAPPDVLGPAQECCPCGLHSDHRLCWHDGPLRVRPLYWRVEQARGAGHIGIGELLLPGPGASVVTASHLFLLMIRRPPRSTLFPYTRL